MVAAVFEAKLSREQAEQLAELMREARPTRPEGVLTAILLVAWIVATRGVGDTLAAVERRWPLLLAILAVQFAAYLSFIVAVKHAGAGSLSTSAVIAIAAAYPAVAALLSGPMLGEGLHWNDALGVALIVSGVIVTQAF